MKTFLRSKSVLFALGAVLALSTVARADDKLVRHHHRRPARVVKATAATESTSRDAFDRGMIPTRDGRHSQDALGRTVGGATGSEYRVPTGSHIPRRYNRRGYATDTPQNLQIIDENDQRFRSQENVSDILRREPGISVRGGR